MMSLFGCIWRGGGERGEEGGQRRGEKRSGLETRGDERRREEGSGDETREEEERGEERRGGKRRGEEGEEGSWGLLQIETERGAMQGCAKRKGMRRWGKNRDSLTIFSPLSENENSFCKE